VKSKLEKVSFVETLSAHTADIFCLATTQTQVLSASGSSDIRIYSIIDPEFPLVQTLEKAHKLGCHHLVTSGNGEIAASAGFGGEVIIWGKSDEKWIEKGTIVGANFLLYQHWQRLIVIRW
jgi:superkiller protein 8